jgi:hypothetical protein
VNKKRLLKLADFIEKLPNKKLHMEFVARPDKKGKIRLECDSAACAMGWSPVVFPKLVKYTEDLNNTSDYDLEEHLDVYVKVGRDTLYDSEAMAELFGIRQYDAERLFGAGNKYYHTPKQVSKGLRKFIETGKVPDYID